jgi:hypothetical protein
MFTGGQSSFQQQQYGQRNKQQQSKDQFSGSQQAALQQVQAQQFGSAAFQQAPSSLQQNQRVPASGDTFSSSFKSQSTVSPYSGSMRTQQQAKPAFGSQTASGGPDRTQAQAFKGALQGDSHIDQFKMQVANGDIRLGVGLPHTASKQWFA